MKIVKRIVVVFVILVIIIIALPFLFKGKIINAFKEQINNNINATIAYDDIDISIIKHFPSATLVVDNMSIITNSPFEGDTLFASKSIYLDLNIRDLFKKQIEKIKVKNLLIEHAKLNLLVNEEGVANYDIAKKDSIKSTNNSEKKDFTFAIKAYQLKNTDVLYDNKKSAVLLDLKNMNHQGNGDFSASQTDLNTQTTIDGFTVNAGNIKYFNKAKIDLDVIVGIDFDKQKFTLKENKLKLNDLNLALNGFIDINDTNQEFDITFNSPKANFKSILSLVPSAYSSNFRGVVANGITDVSGKINGFSSDTEIPNYNIHIKTDKASFKYPNLPKEVTNINFDGTIINTSAKNNTYLDIKNLKFTIDEDTFETSGKITNLTNNPTVDAAFKGTLNLENLTQAYPIKYDGKLTGILKADFTTLADKNSVQQNNFDKIKTKGTASLTDFNYESKELANPIYVKNAAIKFDNKLISLIDFNAKTGKSDIKATGNLENLYAFIFDDKKLKGNFNVASTNFVVSDFLVDSASSGNTENSSKTKTDEQLKIPDFLDITTKIKAKNVVYDNLKLQDVSGTMQLKDQRAILTNTKAKMLDGNITFGGIVNTKTAPSVFDLDLDVKGFDIANSFTTLETFRKLIPIAKAFSGKYNTAFKIKGKLNNDFSPEMNTITGTALADLLIDDIDSKGTPLLQTLTSNLKFLDLKKLNLERLKTTLTFKNGRVTVNPFDLTYKDIKMRVTGNHGFDKSLKYNMSIDLPAKYLGNEAANMLSKLTNVNKDTIRIPLTALIGGDVLKPTVNANFKQAVSKLALKVANYQKQELLNKANDKVNDVIGNVISDIGLDSIIPVSKDPTKSKPKNIINDEANDLLNGIFGKKKKKKKN